MENALHVILIAAKRMQQQVHSTCPSLILSCPSKTTHKWQRLNAQRKLQFTFMCRTFTMAFSTFSLNLMLISLSSRLEIMYI